MLKKIILCSLLTLLPFTSQAEEIGKGNSSGNLNWSVVSTWTMQAKPIDFVQSLDNKKVFILGSDAQVHIFTPKGKKLGSMPVDANITALDIAPRGEMLYLINSKDNSYQALSISFTQKIDISSAPFLGNPDAPVALVEFSDFECPYCSKVKPLLDQLLAANKDKLKIVFKHLPLRNHPQAQPAARASIAAQKQGKFWEMHDELFKTKKISAETITASAEKIGLDMEKFNKDKDSAETNQQLNKDMLDAKNADVSGTPTLFINGRLIQNRQPQAIQQMIDAAIAAAGAK